MNNWKTYIPFIVGLPLLYVLPRPETPGWVGNILYGFVGLLLLIGVIILGWAISRKVKFGPIITTIQGLVPSGGGSIWPKALLILIFILMHLTVWWIWWTWWHDNLWSKWSLIAHLGFALGFLALVKNPKAKPPQHIFGLALILLTSLLVLNETGIVRMGEKWPAGSGIFPPSWSVWASSNKPASSSVPGQSVYVTTERGIIPPGTLKYPREGTFENKEVAERVLAGQWDLIAACFRESGGMKQFNSAGKVLIYENKDKRTQKVTSIDRGACMINSQHDARIPNHPDADTLVGNLEFAKILYNEGKYPNQRGLKPWTPHLTKDEFVFEVPVDADGTETNTFIFPYEDITKYSFHPSVATTITVIDLDKVEHTLDIYPITERDPISGGPVADKIRMYRFKAKDGKASVVTVTYRYK